MNTIEDFNRAAAGVKNVYELKSGSFTAEAGKAYAVDTTEGSFDVTLPASWSEGQEIRFMDAKGTWNTNPPTFLRNGNKIEGFEIDYVDSAQGTFFSAVYVDASQGVRILESGTKPHNLVAPSITGHYIGGSISGDNGTWTVAPFSYVYQHQISDDGSTGWTDIEGATSSSYTPVSGQETKYIRRGVAAVNANGIRAFAYSAASAALEVQPFPAGATAIWKFDDTTDASGNGHTLTNNNGVTFAAGKIGNAAFFDGTNYLSIANPISSGAEYSMAAWINFNNFDSLQWIFEFGDAGGFGLLYHNEISPARVIFTPSNAVYISAPELTAAEWHWVYAYRMADGTCGISVDNGSEVTDNLGEDYQSTLNIGVSMLGAIDCATIYPRVLTTGEKAAIYNAGTGIEP